MLKELDIEKRNYLFTFQKRLQYLVKHGAGENMGKSPPVDD